MYSRAVWGRIMMGLMNRDRSDMRRRNLKRFMAARGLKAKPWSERAGVSPNAVYNFLNGRSNSLSQDTLEALAEAENVTSSTLLDESIIPLARAAQNVTVLGTVQAGAWVEAIEWPLDERYTIAVPFGGTQYENAYGLEVRGDSMNKIYPDGTIIFVVNIYDFDGELLNGHRVVCERTDAAGNVEATVKQLVIEDDGSAWLWPRSTSPQHQQPIAVTESGLRGAHLSGDVTVRVSAIVIRALTSELNR